jgi:hypothetical protein
MAQAGLAAAKAVLDAAKAVEAKALLRCLFDFRVDVGGFQLHMADLFGGTAVYVAPDIRRIMEAAGLVLIEPHVGRRSHHIERRSGLFVYPAAAKAALRGTRWEEACISDLLGSLPRVSRRVRTVDGKQRTGLEVPLEVFRDLLDFGRAEAAA